MPIPLIDFAKHILPFRKSGARTPFSARLAPEQPVYAIGDIHGSSHLLAQLLEVIDQDFQSAGYQNPHLVFVGDYVDRGEESAAVLQQLTTLRGSLPNNVTCLMGNHEKMMLDFLDDPEERGPRWLRNGGLQTLASFGIGALTETAPPLQLQHARSALRQALPDGLEDWLRGLPLYWQSGNVVVTHAGADPTHPIQEQERNTLLWGTRDFTKTPRPDGLWIVHGHIVVDTAHAEAGRIAVDTGAYFSGRLTAAAIAPDQLRFLDTG